MNIKLIFIFFVVLYINLIERTYCGKDKNKELWEKDSKEKLLKLLKKIDKNRDSLIDHFELEIWIANNLKQFDLEDSKQKLKMHDTNNKGSITWSDYLLSTHKYDDAVLKSIRNNTPHSNHTKLFLKEIDLLKRKFNLADLNKDGELTIEEFVNFEHPEHCRYMSQVVIDTVLHTYDTNQDGFISLEEFLYSDHPNKNEEKTNFNKYDKDQNGRLNREEIFFWIMPGIEGTSKVEANHLLGGTNKEFKALTFQQIIKDYESWIKSPATDHGRQLSLEPLIQRDEL